MSLPTTGPISFNDLKLEFGDTYPVAFNEFYAGGGKVPVGASGSHGLIPIAGQISLDQMHGGTGSLLTGAGWKTVAAVPGSIIINGQHIVACDKWTHSDDGGFTWLTDLRIPSTLPISVRFNGTYLGGKYYMFASGSYNISMYTSLDGLSWSGSTFSTDQNPVDGIISSVGRLYGSDILLMSIPNAIYQDSQYSADFGQTWVRSTGVSPTVFIKNAPGGLAAGCDGLFMYCTSSYMKTSPDLVTWTNRTIYDTVGNAKTFTTTLYATTFNNVFMMFGSGYTVVSTDGVSFMAYPVTLPGRTSATIPLIAIGPTYMLAVYPNDAGGIVAARSTDGINWIAVAAPNITPLHVVYVNGYWQVYSAAGSMKYVPV